jgi:tetratricopeptide (TPR) repeat protein
VAARRAAGDVDYLNRIPYFGLFGGLVALRIGDAEAAAQRLRQTARALEEVGEKTNYSTAAALLGRAFADQGLHAEASKYARASKRAARPNDVFANVAWRSLQARVLCEQGKVVASEKIAREAVDFAASSDFSDAHGDALVGLAAVLRQKGDTEESAARLEDAVQLFERKGNVLAAASARSIAAAL